MSALDESTTPWLRDTNRFEDRETRVGRFVPPPTCSSTTTA